MPGRMPSALANKIPSKDGSVVNPWALKRFAPLTSRIGGVIDSRALHGSPGSWGLGPVETLDLVPLGHPLLAARAIAGPAVHFRSPLTLCLTCVKEFVLPLVFRCGCLGQRRGSLDRFPIALELIVIALRCFGNAGQALVETVGRDRLRQRHNRQRRYG